MSDNINPKIIRRARVEILEYIDPSRILNTDCLFDQDCPVWERLRYRVTRVVEIEGILNKVCNDELSTTIIGDWLFN